MKNRVCIFLFNVLLIVHAHKLSAQIHDFDSLRSHNKAFEELADQIGDTLDLYNSSEILKVTLISDFKNLVKRKYKDEYQDAVFKTMFNDTVQITRNIKIVPRGNVRKSTCFIPPLKLNFPKKKAFIKHMESFDKLKMVLDCKRGEIYEQYVLSEYYAYKIQNIINDYSLRVRMLLVTYIDQSGKFKETTKYAFILESIDQCAERHNAIRIETKNIKDINTNPQVLADAYLYQYLIGNTDWSIPAMHNIYLIKSNDPLNQKPYVIPYDFDYAGIVNANYAVADDLLGIESVRERVYRGVCIGDNELLRSRILFMDKKEEIFKLYESDTLLSKNNKRSTISYLDEFFNLIENENVFKRNILESCR